MANLQQQRAVVEQLKRESQVKRITVSQAISDLKVIKFQTSYYQWCYEVHSLIKNGSIYKSLEQGEFWIYPPLDENMNFWIAIFITSLLMINYPVIFSEIYSWQSSRWCPFDRISHSKVKPFQGKIILLRPLVVLTVIN